MTWLRQIDVRQALSRLGAAGRDERGTTAVEYVLISSAIVVAIAAVVFGIGTGRLLPLFTSLANSLANMLG